MEYLDNAQAKALLDSLRGWKLGHDSRCADLPDLIYLTASCATFADGMDLAQKIARGAGGCEDRLGLSVYGFPRHVKITVVLRTWNEEETGQVCGPTRQDIDLARSISAILPAAQAAR